MGASTFHNPMGLHDLLQGYLWLSHFTSRLWSSCANSTALHDTEATQRLREVLRWLRAGKQETGKRERESGRGLFEDTVPTSIKKHLRDSGATETWTRHLSNRNQTLYALYLFVRIVMRTRVVSSPVNRDNSRNKWQLGKQKTWQKKQI
jgi:hypothetical protein